MNALAIALSTAMLFLAVPVFLVFGLGSAMAAKLSLRGGLTSSRRSAPAISIPGQP